MSIVNDIKRRYINGNIVEKLIFINIAIFIATILFNVIQGLYEGQINWLLNWFSLDSEINIFFTKPWSIISYGFLHADFLHILMNLLVLYYIGTLFLEYFTSKQLLSFYLLGTFFGGILFIFSQNYFPLFKEETSILIGASAGISAIFIGIATYMPNYQLKLRFIGFVKLWHLAAIWIGLDVMGLIGNNPGGHFAHLGGDIFGFLFVKNASNTEIKIFDKIANLFKTKKKSPLKTVHKSKEKKKAYTNLNQKQIDAILDKISKSGYDTLTKAEKEFLFKQGKK